MYIASVLHAIFTQSLKAGMLPKDWRNPNITWFYKNDNNHMAENYRLVYLTSVSAIRTHYMYMWTSQSYRTVKTIPYTLHYINAAVCAGQDIQCNPEGTMSSLGLRPRHDTPHRNFFSGNEFQHSWHSVSVAEWLTWQTVWNYLDRCGFESHPCLNWDQPSQVNISR